MDRRRRTRSRSPPGATSHDNARDRPTAAHDRPPPTETSQSPSPPQRKMGSYQMRQGLTYAMPTPKFLHAFKAEAGLATEERRVRATAPINGANPDAEDDGPLIVADDDQFADLRHQLSDADRTKLRIMHPNADLSAVVPEPGATAGEGANTAEETAFCRGPAVDPDTGKPLYQKKTSSVPPSTTTTSTSSSTSAPKKRKKKVAHLLSFD
ncbi:hypothetical protein BC828DRAFT_416240 [Blastocladiella britannica]|nr:hypothetical protein BC828DRAFT_416240 [Blastocladiella britannica]